MVLAWIARGAARVEGLNGLAELTTRGQHGSVGAIDLLIAATAEAHGLSLLHYDHDFDQIAAITGQPM